MFVQVDTNFCGSFYVGPYQITNSSQTMLLMQGLNAYQYDDIRMYSPALTTNDVSYIYMQGQPSYTQFPSNLTIQGTITASTFSGSFYAGSFYAGTTNITGLINQFSSSNAVGLSNLQSTNIVNNTFATITNTLITSNMSIIFVGGTNIFLTNKAAPIGRIVTVIVTNANGSCIITNGTSMGGFGGIYNVGSNNYVPLGALGTLSNRWTGVFDGLNWE
jgi:hypothetical protein